MKYNQLLAFALIAFLGACDNGSGKKDSDTEVGTEIINNPHTGQEDPDNAVQKAPEIQWHHTRHNFGKVYANQEVSHIFKLTNTGDADLVILDKRTSCGCTVPEIPEKPIKPGESSKITVKFERSGLGNFNKQITIIANTVPKEHYLHISGDVVEE